MRYDRRILIVDDDDAIRSLLATVLRRRGLHADCARNGIEAMEMLGLRRYALVLLDLMMPLMNGREVLDQLGALSPSVRPLVLVLTAGLESHLLDATLVVGTIHKPFDVEMLVDTIVGCLKTVEAPAVIEAGADSALPMDEAN